MSDLVAGLSILVPASELVFCEGDWRQDEAIEIFRGADHRDIEVGGGVGEHPGGVPGAQRDGADFLPLA